MMNEFFYLKKKKKKKSFALNIFVCEKSANFKVCDVIMGIPHIHAVSIVKTGN